MLFDSAFEADQKDSWSKDNGGGSDSNNSSSKRVSKAGYFMLCALGRADFSRANVSVYPNGSTNVSTRVTYECL